MHPHQLPSEFPRAVEMYQSKSRNRVDDMGLHLRLQHLAEQCQGLLPLLALLARADPCTVTD
eukprot:8839138-Pyramimonas_sp.AAC.1